MQETKQGLGTPGLIHSYILTFFSALSDATRFSIRRSRWGLHRHRLKSERWKGEEYIWGTLLTSAGCLWRQPPLPWYKYNLLHVDKKQVCLSFLLLLVWAQLPMEDDLFHLRWAFSALGLWHDVVCLCLHCSQWKGMSSFEHDSTQFMADIGDKRDESPYRQASLSLCCGYRDSGWLDLVLSG